MPRLKAVDPNYRYSEAVSAEIMSSRSNSNAYRYQHVTTGVLLDDFRFNKSAPKVGNSFPDFDLLTTTGEHICRGRYLGRKPVLLVFGSITCPMTASSIPPLQRLYAAFGDRVEFVMLNVREAHPAEHYEQPNTFEQKLRHAVALKTRHDIPWTVAVDDLDGALHRLLDTKPNAAFLMDADGRIAFRSLWAGDERALRDALQRVVNGQSPYKSQSAAMLAPMIRGIGYFPDVLTQAGPRAAREMLLAAPPIALAAGMAGLFRRLPSAKRGVAAFLTLGIAMTAAISSLVWLPF